jgi:hypothetical protein
LKGGQKDGIINEELFSTRLIDKPTRVLSIIALSLIILTWVSVLFILYYPFKELDVDSIRVEPSVVALGQEVKVSFHYKKYAADTPEFSRSLVNQDTNTVIDSHRSKAISRAVGEGDFSFLFPIPTHKAAIGKCVIKMSFKYMKFGFRQIDVDVRTKPFTVVSTDAG